jgi:hypothetical protein
MPIGLGEKATGNVYPYDYPERVSRIVDFS